MSDHGNQEFVKVEILRVKNCPLTQMATVCLPPSEEEEAGERNRTEGHQVV